MHGVQGPCMQNENVNFHKHILQQNYSIIEDNLCSLMIYGISFSSRNTQYLKLRLIKVVKWRILRRKFHLLHVDLPFFPKPHYEINKKVHEIR